VRQKHRENAASTSIQVRNQASLVVNQSKKMQEKNLNQKKREAAVKITRISTNP